MADSPTSKVPPPLTADTTYLFICDVQERFRRAIPHFPSVVFAASYLFDAAALLSIPTLITEQYPKALGHTVEELPLPAPGATVVEKTAFSMLAPPPTLAALAAAPARRSVVLVGIEAHICIAQTAAGLLRRGYAVHVVVDGVASQRDADRGVALARLRDAGAVVTTAEAVLFELLGDKGHPQFKAASGIVKRERPVGGITGL
ncbi:hypothetical protein BU14_0711s0012 [Porphyra umbilicalis]|uniref:Isochorismatase-like domain-containing protein n=1 Tax=Porphyra umbilicalis TaxID=2786 RepID=A0A1X6NPW7_PORUM|nr:hypothetical protein BU14_0711s0012 [Porphyra umbilicalis]|eukprot:OSX70615.1 hypothetical protein BU14_0711s0012 [Porphyra umbilicalis]